MSLTGKEVAQMHKDYVMQSSSTDCSSYDCRNRK